MTGRAGVEHDWRHRRTRGRLLGLGAREVADRRRPDGSGWVVLADPEGNELCILRNDTERSA